MKRAIRWGAGVLGVLLAGMALFAGAVRFADGPVGVFPGGPLVSGAMIHMPVDDWGFARDVELVELQLMSPLRSRTTWVVVEGSSIEATSRAVEVIETLGANPLFMTAASHDEVVASISHLPQLLAASLLAAVSQTPDALNLAAGSFRDLTRVAASQPIPWVEILKSNEAAVLAAVERLRIQLDTVEAAVLADDDELLAYLAHAREARRALGAPVAAVRVGLADEPGELGKVGHALEESRVDVRDIQIRHAPYGGGGVLTLSVRAGEEEALRHALEEAGLLLVQ